MVYLPKRWEVPTSTRTVWYLIIGILDLFDNMGLTLSGLLDSGLPHFLRYFKEEIKDQFKGKPPNKMWPVSVYSNDVLCLWYPSSSLLFKKWPPYLGDRVMLGCVRLLCTVWAATLDYSIRRRNYSSSIRFAQLRHDGLVGLWNRKRTVQYCIHLRY